MKIGACLILSLGLVMTVAYADAKDSEKCYGIAKAGLNDCDGNISTCDKSVIDGDPNFYLNVPKGLCDKIVGGMTNLGSGPQPGGGLKSIPLTPPAAPTAPPTTVPTNPSATPATPMPPPQPAAPAVPQAPAGPAMPSATPATGINK